MQVEQIDRDAAQGFGCGFCPDDADEFLAEAFARHRHQARSNAQADVTAACKRILQLEASLNDFLTWTGALAVSGIPSPESWALLSRITTKAEQALNGKPRP